MIIFKIFLMALAALWLYGTLETNTQIRKCFIITLILVCVHFWNVYRKHCW